MIMKKIYNTLENCIDIPVVIGDITKSAIQNGRINFSNFLFVIK